MTLLFSVFYVINYNNCMFCVLKTIHKWNSGTDLIQVYSWTKWFPLKHAINVKVCFFPFIKLKTIQFAAQKTSLPLTFAEPKMEAICSSRSSSSFLGWMIRVTWQLLLVANFLNAPMMWSWTANLDHIQHHLLPYLPWENALWKCRSW